MYVPLLNAETFDTNRQITCPFGWRNNPFTGNREFHTGTDMIDNTYGTTHIVAPHEGVVIYTGFDADGYGNYAILYHGDQNGEPLCTLYAHMKSVRHLWESGWIEVMS